MTAPQVDSTVDSAVAADLAAGHALLGCLAREVAAPEGQLVLGPDDWLLIRLPHHEQLLRVRVDRVSTVGAHRFAGPVQVRRGDGWAPVDAPGLAALVGAELRLRTAVANPEFVGQVTASRDALARVLDRRPPTDPYPVADPVLARYVHSEQSLVYGHPRHPAPKWRTGEVTAWDRYAPELRTGLRLHWLGVAAPVVLQDTVDGAGFDAHAGQPAPPGLPSGYAALPVHPWQRQILAGGRVAPAVNRALSTGELVDLGEHGPVLRPTASVRTLYDPAADVFLKTSLHVRITNCLRKNSRYELPTSVALTRMLGPLIAARPAELAGRFALLPEPAYRSAALGVDAMEALGVIVRGGLRPHLRPGETPLLAGALASADPEAGVRALIGDADGTQWWDRYLRVLVPAVLWLWAEHGVVLEPHLQNVVAVLDSRGYPVRVLLRDLEGTKLVTDRHREVLAGWPPELAGAVGYEPDVAWRRIAYCLFVNHLVELAGALAGDRPGAELRLWEQARAVVAECAEWLGRPPQLRALLAGVPLPAKANLLLRWQRRADRHAGYVPFPNPLGAAVRVP